MSRIEIKQKRVDECNEIIKLIATHGRKFFNYEDRTGRISKLTLGPQERVYFIDGYTGKVIYTHRRYCHWKGFSEGGTLKGWVEAFRDYITFGTKLNIKAICPVRINPDNGNIWGYSDDEAKKLIESLADFPAFKKDVKNGN